jgi:hypothetical protein
VNLFSLAIIKLKNQMIMKKNLLKLMLISILPLTMSSCRILYIPNTPNTPLLEEKGDLKVNLSTNNFQAAYAVTENIGIMANGYYNKNNWNVTSGNFDNRYSTTRFLLEGGAGYFKKIGEKGVFETYAGAGYGNLSYDYTLFDAGIQTQNNTWDSNKMKFFIQPNIGIVSDNLEFAFTTRFVGLNFMNTLTNYTDSQLAFENLTGVEDRMWMFVEPGVVFRAGWAPFKFQAHMLYSYKLNPEPLNTRNFVIGFAAHINIGAMMK